MFHPSIPVTEAALARAHLIHARVPNGQDAAFYTSTAVTVNAGGVIDDEDMMGAGGEVSRHCTALHCNASSRDCHDKRSENEVPPFLRRLSSCSRRLRRNYHQTDREGRRGSPAAPVISKQNAIHLPTSHAFLERQLDVIGMESFAKYKN